MAIRVIVHVTNEDPFVADIEAMPSEAATSIFVRNPRTREGRPVPWSSGPTKGFLFPMTRIAYLAFPISDEDVSDLELFYRDKTKGRL
jgi:hypothetical protein